MPSKISLFILLLGLCFLTSAQTSGTSSLDTISPIRKSEFRAKTDTSNAYAKASLDSVILIREQFSFFADSALISDFQIRLYRIPDSVLVDSVMIPFQDTAFYSPFGNRYQVSGPRVSVKSPNILKQHSLYGRLKLYFLDQSYSNDISF